MPVEEKPTFERIVQEHGSFVRRTLAHLGVVARHLADVEQEVFRGVHRGLSAFDPSRAPNPETAVRSWLFGICERQAASHRRAETRRAEVLHATEDLDAERDGGPTTEESFIEAERKALLFRLLATLEPRRRAVIIAYELEGMEMVEVAASIGIPVNTCWNRLRLARADLRAAWTRMSAQQASASVAPRLAASASQRPPSAAPRAESTSRTGSRGAIVPFAFLSPSFAGDGVAPLGTLARLFHAARERLLFDTREWLSEHVRDRLLDLGRKGLSRWAGAAVQAKAGVSGIGLLTAAAVAAIVAVAPGRAPAPASPTAISGATVASADPPEIVPDSLRTALAEAKVPPEVDTQAPAAPSVSGARGPAMAGVARSVIASPPPTSGGRASSHNSGVSADVGLREETKTIANANEAYLSGDTARAERLLDSYDQKFPDGRMKGSSTIVRLRALLASGRRNEAREVARQYLAAHPNCSDRPIIESIVGKVD